MLTPVFSLLRRGFYWMTAFVLLLLLTGCPPKMPCDEKIKDPKPYQQRIEDHPVIQALSEELAIEKIEIAPCFVQGKASVYLTFQTPRVFSPLELQYRGTLVFSFTKEATLSIPEGNPWGISEWDGQSIPSILEAIQKKINELENHPRVREIIDNTEPDPLNAFHWLDNGITGEVFRKENRMTYSFEAHQVMEYLLLNNLEWQHFPEIRQAHEIIQTRLLTGELSNCQIGKGEMHNYTTAITDEKGGWYITVALQCNEKWKDAFLHLFANGSFERLGIQTEY